MFNQALEDISRHLQQALSGFTDDIETHPGRFTEQELARMLTRKKSVRIAIENTQSVTVNGQGIQEARLLVAAYIICSDSKDGPRHQIALDITEALLKELPFNRFGTDYLKPVEPKTIAAENLYSGDIDRKGIALWGISWEQTIRQP